MVNICNSEQHVVLMRILDARNRPSITPDMPLWKLKLTEEEYTNLKETLVQNAYRLEDFGIEAALCYAEWWRRDYNGGIPSREDVAVGLGLPHYCWEQLYKAARHGLISLPFKIRRRFHKYRIRIGICCGNVERYSIRSNCSQHNLDLIVRRRNLPCSKLDRCHFRIHCSIWCQRTSKAKIV